MHCSLEWSLGTVMESMTQERLQVKLAAELRKVSSWIPNTFDCFPVVKGYFGLYLYSVVAPDHLLAGIVRSSIDICFLQLEDKERKQKMYIMIAVSMHVFGIKSHPFTFNGSLKGTNRLLLSTVYAVLAIVHVVLIFLRLALALRFLKPFIYFLSCLLLLFGGAHSE